MRTSVLFIILLFTTSLGFSQSLQIAEESSTRGNSMDEFLVAGHSVDLSERGLSSTSSLNAVTAVSANINQAGVTLFAGDGSRLHQVDYKAAPRDNSLKVYVKPNGGIILRENVANFLFYDPEGNIQRSVSNSSQSTEGESVSELAADPMFKTIILYNPKIVRNGVEGSRARLVKSDGGITDIFYNSSRYIKEVFVSKSGQFVAIATAASGTNDMVYLMDRFGNKLGEFSFDQPVAGVRFSNGGEYVTIRSNGRVGVYSVIGGEREGSTSFRSRLQYATYVPEDQNIIAMTADQIGDNLTDIEFHAINLSARSIERTEYDSELGVSSLVPISLERSETNSYTFHGLNKKLDISVSF